MPALKIEFLEERPILTGPKIPSVAEDTLKVFMESSKPSARISWAELESAKYQSLGFAAKGFGKVAKRLNLSLLVKAEKEEGFLYLVKL